MGNGSFSIFEGLLSHFQQFPFLPCLFKWSSELDSFLYILPLHFSPSYTQSRAGFSELLHILKGGTLDREVPPSSTNLALCEFELLNIKSLSMISEYQIILSRFYLSISQNHVGAQVKSEGLQFLSDL